MAVPPTAQTFAKSLDPHEEIDWIVDATDVLEAGEQIADYALTLLPEAVALGLTIMSGDGRDLALVEDATAVKMWLTIDPAFKTNAAFDGAGTTLGLEILFETNSIPARTRNRTFLIKVAQQ